MTTVESDYYAYMDFDRAAMTRRPLALRAVLRRRSRCSSSPAAAGEFLELLARGGHRGDRRRHRPGHGRGRPAAGCDVALGDALAALADRADALAARPVLRPLPRAPAERAGRAGLPRRRPGARARRHVRRGRARTSARSRCSAYDFWRDPTHVRPYDPVVLAFFADQAGLEVVESGPNPRVDPGPPPHLWPIEPAPVPAAARRGGRRSCTRSAGATGGRGRRRCDRARPSRAGGPRPARAVAPARADPRAARRRAPDHAAPSVRSSFGLCEGAQAALPAERGVRRRTEGSVSPVLMVERPRRSSS